MGDPRVALDCVFIPFGMPPKVIVIVQDEYLLLLAVLLLVEIGCRPSAEPPSGYY